MGLASKNPKESFMVRRAMFVGLVGLVGVVALGGLTGCGVAKPSLKFKTVQLRETNLEGTTLNVVYALKNPNPVGIQLASVAYKLEVEGKQVVAGKPPDGLKVRPRSVSELVFPAQIKFQDIVPVLLTFLNKDEARFRASGEVGISTALGVLRLPLSYEGVFPVPKVPALDLRAPRVSNLSLTGARVVFPIEVTNRNRFALPLTELAASFAIAGANVGRASAPIGAGLGAGEARTVEVPLDIDFLKAGAAVANALRKGSAPVKLEGALKVGSFSVPLNLSRNVSFR
jgi:LEA14-like dessication related protein